MNKFVGSRVVETKTEVQEIIQRLEIPSPYYYFLRWPHKVSGILTQAQFTDEILPDLPDGLSPEGQVFTHKWELRWERRVRRIKPQRTQYHLLVLGQGDIDSQFKDFDILQEESKDIPWKTVDYPAVIHQERFSEGTRFPKGFRLPKEFEEILKDPKKTPLHQRHFIHANTGITHFVALVPTTNTSSSEE